MSLSVDSQSQVLPGFRFQPTEQKLLGYYLKKKAAYEWIDLDFIQEVDLNNFEPWDLKEICKIGSGPQNDSYCYSRQIKKYPSGIRTNRSTAAGFWKATGRDKVIYNNLQKFGLRKTLVFYKGRAPHGQKTDWIMHEYRLQNDDNNSNTTSDTTVSDFTGRITQEDIWVVCRVFEKKDRHKLLDTPSSSSDKTIQFSGSCMNELDSWESTISGDSLLQSPTAPIVEIEQLDGFSDWVTANSFSELPHDPNSTHRTHVHHLFGYM